MKLKELLNLLDRILKDVAPKSSLYSSCLREHMAKTHKDLLDEEVSIE
jgi:hypothetical protein